MVPEEEIAVLAERIYAAVDLLAGQSLVNFSPELLIRVNTAIRGREEEGSILRSWDVSEFAYLSAVSVKADMERFVEEIMTLRAQRGVDQAIDVLFDVHWNINLRGHYFADACSRTATVVGCWATYQLTGRVLRLPPREHYLAVASSAEPRQVFDRLCRLENSLG